VGDFINLSRGNKKGRLDFIDSLRGIAALAIVVYHLSFLGLPTLLDEHILLARSSLILFFIISSFTLYYSLDNKRDEEKRFQKFYIRRFFRIAPLFYIMILIYLIKDVLILKTFPTTSEIMANFAFIFNLYPPYFESIVTTGWTIGVEMLFYLILPLIYLGFNTIRRSLIFLACTMALADIVHYLLSQFAPFSQEIMSGYMSVASFLPVFSTGIICYLIYKNYIHKISRAYGRLISILLFILTFFILFMVILNPDFYFIPLSERYWQAIAFSTLCLSLSLYPNRLLVNGFTAFYGKISYSVYLLHPLLIYFLKPAYNFIYAGIAPPGLAFFYCLLLTLILLTLSSLFTYRFIEEKGILYGKMLIARA
jgi:peptidoglycan/LPS O-acetylase OafA/YrhL